MTTAPLEITATVEDGDGGASFARVRIGGVEVIVYQALDGDMNLRDYVVVDVLTLGEGATEPEPVVPVKVAVDDVTVHDGSAPSRPQERAPLGRAAAGLTYVSAEEDARLLRKHDGD